MALQDSAKSLPLFRGVLHDCDRITRNFSEASIAQLSTSAHSAHTSLHNNFYALFADALIHSGWIIGKNPDLILPNEPDSAEAYFQAARDLFDQNVRENQGSFTDVLSQLTWGSTLLFLADTKAADIPRVGDDLEDEDSEDEDGEKEMGGSANRKDIPADAKGLGGADSDEGKEVSQLLHQGLSHYNTAFKSCSAVASVFPSDTENTVPSNADETEDTATLAPLTQTQIAISLASQLLDIAEDQLPRSMRKPWLSEVKSAITKAESTAKANDPAIEAAIAKAWGRHQLASFVLVLPPKWENLEELAGVAGGQEAFQLVREGDLS